MYRNISRSFNHKSELTNDVLMAKAPSIFASQPMAGVSGKYTFLPTAQIVDEMRANGWAPVDVQEQRVRLEDRKGFQKHLIRFQRHDIIAKVGEYAPEIALLNSHDRSSAYQIHVALFRFICGNGLMVSDSTVNHVSIRHSGYETGEVLKASFEILGKVPELTGKVEMFRARQLSEAEKIEFAKNAITLRYDDAETAPISPARLLAPHRIEDQGSDLWKVLNRVQENLTQGGQKDYSRRKENGDYFSRTRAITGLDQNVQINKGLWQLAETFRVN
jgi:hypothetical protein